MNFRLVGTIRKHQRYFIQVTLCCALLAWLTVLAAPVRAQSAQCWEYTSIPIFEYVGAVSNHGLYSGDGSEYNDDAYGATYIFHRTGDPSASVNFFFYSDYTSESVTYDTPDTPVTILLHTTFVSSWSVLGSSYDGSNPASYTVTWCFTEPLQGYSGVQTLVGPSPYEIPTDPDWVPPGSGGTGSFAFDGAAMLEVASGIFGGLSGIIAFLLGVSLAFLLVVRVVAVLRSRG